MYVLLYVRFHATLNKSNEIKVKDRSSNDGTGRLRLRRSLAVRGAGSRCRVCPQTITLGAKQYSECHLNGGGSSVQ